MTQDPKADPDPPPRPRLRRRLLGIVIALAAFEVIYVVVANLGLRSQFMSDQINRKPEKMLIQWSSATTYFPGVVHVEGFSMRNQSRKVQFYLEVREVRAVISLLKLPLKTLHIRNVNGTDVDFRLRSRLDFVRPADSESEEEAPKPIAGADFFPEIPGLTNPPDPKPEELYPRKKKRRAPWTIRMGGVDIEGDILVAVDRLRLEGNGHVGGAMTFKLRESIRIRKATLDLRSTRLLIDSEVASDDLDLDVRSRWQPFPPKGAKVPQIIAGVSGSFAIRGNLFEKGAVKARFVPGLTTFGTGALDATLELKRGALQPGSGFTLQSDNFNARVMALDAHGSATVDGTTTRKDGANVTDVRVEFDQFSLVDPSNASVGVEGAGLSLDASWSDFVLFGGSQPTSVAIELPRTELLDVSVLAALLPPQENVSIVSGSGQVEGSLAIDASATAVGRVAVDAKDIDLIVRDVPMHADLAVLANLSQGDLEARRFEVSDTTVSVDNVVGKAPPKARKAPEPWWCSIQVDRGTAVFSKPMTVNGSLRLRMYDTSAVVAMINDFTKPPKWMSLMPNVKNVDGKFDLDMEPNLLAVTNMVITGDKLELLGDLRVADKMANGRIFARYGKLSAGIALTDGKTKLHLAKPRKWFEEGAPAADDPSGGR
jgi:hypothetical protein